MKINIESFESKPMNPSGPAIEGCMIPVVTSITSETEKKELTYGVIIGRFQVAELHPAHLDLFMTVAAQNDRVIVFIGVSKTITNRNPLDFETRRMMISQRYPEFIILPMPDEKSDYVWSKKLDEKIKDVVGSGGYVVLYGGRDSFRAQYHGDFSCIWLSTIGGYSGTEHRKTVRSYPRLGREFRAGAIYAIGNQYPKVMMTVDVAIVIRDGDKMKVLLGKKPNEENYRFIGGFVNLNENLERAARREVREEVDVALEQLDYIGSYPIPDWRYAKDLDAGIVTAFFLGWASNLSKKAGDDIETATWFDVEQMPLLEVEHEVLYYEFKNRMRKLGWKL